MKTVTTTQKVTALLFLALLAVLLGRSVSSFRSMISLALKESSLKGAIAAMEERFAERMTLKWPALLDVHSVAQRILGKTEIGNFYVVKDRLGMLQMGGRGSLVLNGGGNISEETQGQLAAFSAFCGDSGIPFICMSTPPRILDKYLPDGLSSFEESGKRAMIRTLESLGIEVFAPFSGRETTGAEQLGIFYRTDHHWRAEAAFSAHAMFLEYLAGEHGFDFPDRTRNTDIANYRVDVRKESFLGSGGRRAGRYYTEWDDFSLITPAFDTKMTRVTNGKKNGDGTFGTAIISARRLEDEESRYAAYLGGDYAEDIILNENGKYSILILQDSFGLPFSSFLSLSFAKTVILDLRHYTAMSVMEYMRENPGFDAVLCINQFTHPQFSP